MSTDVMETKRLILRPWRDSDISLFAAMNQDLEVMQFFPSTLTWEESANCVAAIRQHFKEHGFGLFALELKASGEFMGFVGLSTPTFQAHFTPCVEIGWRIAKRFWNQGYATEAAKMVLHAAFRIYHLPAIVSFTAVSNLRSIRVMEKIGLMRDSKEDFDHPTLPKNHALSRHVLYRMNLTQLNAKDAILIKPYCPAWVQQAQQELVMLKMRLSFPWIVGMAHIGSTAIPDLSAKPIIDLAIGVCDLEAARAIIPILQQEDYVFWAGNPDKTKLFFVKGMPPFGERRTHHIHVMPITHHDWIIRPLFRDYLIAHPDVKQAYAQLKQDLMVQYPQDREAYTESKTSFIRAINLQAMQPHLHFVSLQAADFSQLLNWLNSAHVKAHWDRDIDWTLQAVAARYQPRLESNSAIHCFMVNIQNDAMGFIQFYPLSSERAGVDFFIGEPTFLRKGFGVAILNHFLKEYIDPTFSECCVDPASSNTAAIHTYLHCGFKKQQADAGESVIQMVRVNGDVKSIV